MTKPIVRKRDLFTPEERERRANKRMVANFILTRARPPADLVERAHEMLAELKAEQRERRKAAHRLITVENGRP